MKHAIGKRFFLIQNKQNENTCFGRVTLFNVFFKTILKMFMFVVLITRCNLTKLNKACAN